MAYASRSGRAKTSSSSPSAFAVCDRCGIWHNHKNLQWQFQWRGASLQNTRFLVCRSCLDLPSEQLRAIVVPADPTPIVQPRTEPFLQDETDYQTITQLPVIDARTGLPIPGTTTLITQDGLNLTTQVIGAPTGLEQGAVMPLDGTVHYGEPVPALSITANGSTTITVTCSAPHGLVTNDQIAVEGLANPKADGFYSVVVTTATAFTYMTYANVPTQALLTPTTNIITALVGLPRGYDQIPLVGSGSITTAVTPPAFIPSLKFNDKRDSQYLGII